MKMKITKKWLDTHDWMIRSDNNGYSHAGYKWKKGWNIAKDWDETPVCGGGLHGEGKEAHGFRVQYGRIVLCETRGKRVVIDGDKLKVREARIVAVNGEIPKEALEMVGYRVLSGKVKEVKDGDFCLVFGKIEIGTVRGGYVCSYVSSKVEIDTVSGGWVWSYGSSKIKIDTVSGGHVQSYGSSKVEIGTVRGGYVWSYDSSKVEIKLDKRWPAPQI